MVEIVVKAKPEVDVGVYTLSSDEVLEEFQFDMDTFWQSLWVIHDLLHEGLAFAPDGELGITLTSPSNRSLRYLVKKV